MWRIPAPLIAGGQGFANATITADTYIGDLYAYLDSPVAPTDVTLTIDGADVGEIIISSAFASGSTFTFNCINAGRILGVGGNGGDGSDDLGSSGTVAGRGDDGTAAISSDGFPVTVNIDDGFLLGGGGGGGGGSYTDSVDGDAGGGGGGGQGFTGGVKGQGGASIGLPPAADGTNGSRGSFGTGGAPAGVDGEGSGGRGGAFGYGGLTGESTDLIIGASSVLVHNGGLGGRAGDAFQSINGAAITFSGAKSEATLRSEGRVLGDSDVVRLALPSTFVSVDTVSLSETIGITVSPNGQFTRTKPSGDTTSDWATATLVGFGNDYDIRIPSASPGSETLSGTFDVSPGAVGTWFNLSVARTYSFTTASTRNTAALLEIRRADFPAGTPADYVSDSVYITIGASN